ncbi:MAG: Holliday junction ATP-dependent DNA helicase RuvA [Candidatus Omnitrophica bacterium]|nr:Holliday junction ATP-dependent DNA helicase RuvA [Candidatus Omnitrophota bacterium]
MISRISGKVIERGNNYVVVENGGISYQVLIPANVMQRLDESLGSDSGITLRTFHYLQNEQAKSIPVLIGFLNDIEKDFFEVFITVSGIGPRAALKALNKPISEIARAIDEGDLVFLKSLPGIGEQRAKEIVAKLQNKIGKFGLVQDRSKKQVTNKSKDIAEEALAVLIQLEYKRAEALVMINKALEAHPDLETTEELLNMVYKQKRVK